MRVLVGSWWRKLGRCEVVVTTGEGLQLVFSHRVLEKCVSASLPRSLTEPEWDFGKTLRNLRWSGRELATAAGSGYLNLKTPAKTWQRRISVHCEIWDSLTLPYLFVRPIA